MARPSLFSEAVAEEICTRIMCGDSLAAICRDDDMPAYRTVMKWLQDDPEFRRNYASARADQGHADADEIRDIATRMIKGEIDPAAGRAAIDALKWTAARRQPKVYGDSTSVKHSGAIGTFDASKHSDEELAVLASVLGASAAGGRDAEGGEGGDSEASG